MGKKARHRRSEEKQLAKLLNFTLEGAVGASRTLGYRETEMGELKAVVTKAEARRRFLRWRGLCAELMESVRNFDIQKFFTEERVEEVPGCEPGGTRVARTFTYKDRAVCELLDRMNDLVKEDLDSMFMGDLLATV
jgi:hypothetical protein